MNIVANEVVLNLLIGLNIGKAKHQLFSIAFELIANILNLMQQIIHRDLVGKNQGIVTPNHMTFTKLIHKSFEGINTPLNRRHTFLKPFSDIVIKGVLNVTLYLRYMLF